MYSEGDKIKISLSVYQLKYKLQVASLQKEVGAYCHTPS